MPPPPELDEADRDDDDAYSETQEFGAYMAELGVDFDTIDDEDIPVLAAGYQKQQSARKHVAKKHPRGGPQR